MTPVFPIGKRPLQDVMLQRVAACCSVLQCRDSAGLACALYKMSCCIVLQRVAVCCSIEAPLESQDGRRRDRRSTEQRTRGETPAGAPDERPVTRIGRFRVHHQPFDRTVLQRLRPAHGSCGMGGTRHKRAREIINVRIGVAEGGFPLSFE